MILAPLQKHQVSLTLFSHFPPHQYLTSLNHLRQKGEQEKRILGGHRKQAAILQGRCKGIGIRSLSTCKLEESQENTNRQTTGNLHRNISKACSCIK